MARLGQLLVQADLVTENNVARALGIQHFAGGRLGTLLLERGSIDEDNLGKTLALQHGCDYVPWAVLSDVSPVVIAALPAKFAIKHAAVPYERGENYLKLALRDPGDLRILDELFFVTGRKIIAGVAPEVRIYQALEKYYGERRIPRYVILADKLSRPLRTSRAAVSSPPPPPDFFPGSPRKARAAPGPQEVWGDAEQDTEEPRIIQSWKLPDQQVGGWAGTSSPGSDSAFQKELETISWEEMPAIPALWIPEPVAPRPEAASQPEPVKRPGREGSRMPQEPLPEAQPPTRAVPPAPAAAAPEPETSPTTAWPRSPELPATVVPDERPALPRVFSFEPKAPPSPLVVAEGRSAHEVALPVEAPPSAVEEAPARQLEPARVAASPASSPSSTAPPISPSDLATPSSTEFPEFAEATDRDSIAAAALAAIARRFPRGAVFVVKPLVVAAWGAAGDGTSPDHLRDFVIPWDEPSVFLNVRLSRSFYLGPLPPLPHHDVIAIAMGGWPQECLVQAIVIKEKPVAFLYAEFTRDHGATPMDLAYMRELATTASAAFASAIRLRKKEI